MIFVNAVARKLSAEEKDVALFLADEYWAPKQEWRFWEYLSPEIAVLEKHQWPDLIALSVALGAYMDGSDILKRILGSLG